MKLKERLRSIKKWFATKIFNFKSWGKTLKSLNEPLNDIIKNKHRFVVLDTNTYQEKISFELTGINIFVTLGISTIVLIILTIILIAFTPLREFIPGYTNSEMVEQTYHNSVVIDSLEKQLDRQEWMIQTMQEAISGKAMPNADEIQKKVDSLSALGVTAIEYRRSKADSLLCEEVEKLEGTAKKQKK